MYIISNGGGNVIKTKLKRLNKQLPKGSLKHGIVSVLKTAKYPMHVNDIYEEMSKRNLYDFARCKTPRSSMSAALSTGMKNNIFTRTGPSEYKICSNQLLEENPQSIDRSHDDNVCNNENVSPTAPSLVNPNHLPYVGPQFILPNQIPMGFYYQIPPPWHLANRYPAPPIAYRY